MKTSITTTTDSADRQPVRRAHARLDVVRRPVGGRRDRRRHARLCVQDLHEPDAVCGEVGEAAAGSSNDPAAVSSTAAAPAGCTGRRAGIRGHAPGDGSTPAIPRSYARGAGTCVPITARTMSCASLVHRAEEGLVAISRRWSSSASRRCCPIPCGRIAHARSRAPPSREP